MSQLQDPALVCAKGTQLRFQHNPINDRTEHRVKQLLTVFGSQNFLDQHVFQTSLKPEVEFYRLHFSEFVRVERSERATVSNTTNPEIPQWHSACEESASVILLQFLRDCHCPPKRHFRSTLKRP